MPSVLDKPFFQNEAAAYAKLESIVWPNGPGCVHCGEVGRIGLLKGTATRPGLYKCYACRKQFRVTVGTVFEASHIPCVTGSKRSTSWFPARRAFLATNCTGPWASR